MVPRPTRRPLLGGLLLLLALLIGPLAQSATAGTYDVWTFKTPSGTPTSTAGWTASSSLLYDQPTDDCATGGRLSAKFTATGGGVSGGLSARWLFTAPAGTTITTASLDRALVTRTAAGDHQGVARAAIYRDGFVDDAGHRIESCDGGAEPCPKRGTTDVKINATSFGISAGCAGPSGGSLCVRGEGSRAGVAIDSAKITLKDDHAPVAKASGEILTPARPVRGSESIRLSATDVGSGVWQAEVRIGATIVVPRRTVDANGGRCSTVAGTKAFGDPQPCDTSVSATLPFSAKGVKDGSQLLTVTVWDAANNPAVAVSQPVMVDNAHRIQADGTILMPRITADDQLDQPFATDGSGTTVNVGALRPTSSPSDPQAQRIVQAMNTLADAQLPYCWGGGHQSTPAVPSAGSYCWRGNPAKKYRDSGSVGFDCSSSVSWVLQQAGYAIPTMTSGQFAGTAEPGPGKFLTIWANGAHVYLEIVIDGTHYFWGTSVYNPEHGPGWHPPRSSAGFTARHIQGL